MGFCFKCVISQQATECIFVCLARLRSRDDQLGR